MKNGKKRLAGLLALLLLMASMPLNSIKARTEDWMESEEWMYILDEEHGIEGEECVELKKYIGEDTDIIVPAEIEGKKVTSINLFYSFSYNVESVTIPDNVRYIGKTTFGSCASLTSLAIGSGVTTIESDGSFGLFRGCSSLESITVDENNTVFDSREDCNAIIRTETNELFAGCKGTKVPDSVVSIGTSAFWGCSGLESVVLPDNMESIGKFAFEGCSGLTELIIPDSVTSIGGRAFTNCENLTSVSIGKGITSLETYVFYGCKKLQELTIPNSVTNIGAYAFSNCSSLKNLTIPDSVTNIDEAAFHYCSGLESITVDSNNEAYDSRNNCNAIISKDGGILIAGCSNTKMPDHVTAIGEYAFSGCSGLTELELPGSLKKIRYGAFVGCSGLTELKLPDSLEEIGEQAFYNCSGLTEIIIPNSVVSIGKVAFSGCSGLTECVISNSVTSIETSVFSNCSSLESITIPDSVTSIGYSAFYNCSSMKSVTIPGSVTNIGSNAFGFSEGAKIPDFVIYGTDENSAAADYAKEHDFLFRLVSDNQPPDSSQDDPAKEDISKSEVTLEKNSYIYDGKAKTPAVTVRLNGKTLTLNTDYTVSYSNNVNIGTAKAVVAGKGNYTGSKTVNFTIIKAEEQQDMSITCTKKLYKVTYGAKPFQIRASSSGKLTFASSKPKIAAVDKNTGKVTVKNTGIAVITVRTDKDLVRVTVKVSPKKPAIKSVKAAKGKKLAVKWAKDKRASGYQIQVSAAKNFKKSMKSQRTSKTSYTFKKLKAGKKYYVRLRSYKKVGKETLYGPWSKVKQSSKIK